MSSDFFAHATGLAALVLNISCLLCRCDLALRRQSVAAGVLWALNNLVLGAQAAAALSVVSASRTATSAVALQRGHAARRNLCLLFLGITVTAALLTWHDAWSALTLAGSLLSTLAMFYLRGSRLRLAMLASAVLWMVNAWQVGSWEQMAANLMTMATAAWGALNARDSARPAS